MRKYTVRLTPQAQEQIREIVLYIRDGLSMPQAAEKLFEVLSSAIAGLSTMPERFKKIEDSESTNVVVRRANVQNYSLFYTVDKEQSKVYVFAVLYGTPSDDRLAKLLRDLRNSHQR